MRRIFISLPLSEETAKEILKWRKKYADLPVRWIEGKNLHLTLIPPWYEDDIEETKSKIENIKNNISFEIRFKEIEYGPNSKKPRLIWAKGERNSSAENLKLELENIFGVKSGNHPWVPHITLARFREEDFSRFRIKNIQEKIDWKELVEEVVIMESHLSREGADYEILYRKS